MKQNHDMINVNIRITITCNVVIYMYMCINITEKIAGNNE